MNSFDGLPYFNYRYGRIYYREVQSVNKSVNNSGEILVIVTTENRFITLYEPDSTRFLREYEEYVLNA